MLTIKPLGPGQVCHTFLSSSRATEHISPEEDTELPMGRVKDEPPGNSSWGWWSWGLGWGEIGEGERPKSQKPSCLSSSLTLSLGRVGSRRQCHPSLNASFLKHPCMSTNQVRNSWQIQSPSRPFYPRNLRNQTPSATRTIFSRSLNIKQLCWSLRLSPFSIQPQTKICWWLERQTEMTEHTTTVTGDIFSLLYSTQRIILVNCAVLVRSKA